MAKKPAEKSKPKSKGTDGCAMAMPGMGPDRRDVSIRKISNGYVLSESGVRKGEYFQRETFTPKQPKVQIAPTKRD